jgi:hypothetical protein
LNKLLAKAIDQISGPPLFAPKLPAKPTLLEEYVLSIRTQFATTEEAVRYLFDHEVQAARYLHSLLPSIGVADPQFPSNVNALLLSTTPSRSL